MFPGSQTRGIEAQAASFLSDLEPEKRQEAKVCCPKAAGCPGFGRGGCPSRDFWSPGRRDPRPQADVRWAGGSAHWHVSLPTPRLSPRKECAAEAAGLGACGPAPGSWAVMRPRLCKARPRPLTLIGDDDGSHRPGTGRRRVTRTAAQRQAWDWNRRFRIKLELQAQSRANDV